MEFTITTDPPIQFTVSCDGSASFSVNETEPVSVVISVFRDGVDGYTPVKGVDYFDGEDGYTPVKGVDYFDGEDAVNNNLEMVRAANPTIEGDIDGNGNTISNIRNAAAPQEPATLAQVNAVQVAVNTYADNLILQLINGAPDDGNTLKELNDKILAISAIIGDAQVDGDLLVNKVIELMSIFSSFPEGSDMLALLAAKVNTSDVVNSLTQVAAGKVLDASQGKELKDLIDALSIAVSGKQTALTAGILGALYTSYAAKNTLGDADTVVSRNNSTGDAVYTSWLNVWTLYMKSKADALYLPKSKIVSTGYQSITGYATNVTLVSFLIPAGTFASGDVLAVYISGWKSVTAAALRYFVMHDTVFGGVTHAIANNISIGTSSRTATWYRELYLDGTTLRNTMPENSTSNSPYTNGNVGGTSPFNPAVDNYITLYGNPTATTEVMGLFHLIIKKIN